MYSTLNLEKQLSPFSRGCATASILGGPAQIQSHERKKIPPFLFPKKSAVRSPIFLLARPPSLPGGLTALLLLPPVRPPPKNRAAQRTLVKATPHSGLQIK
jgi:hypothetical protein